MIIHSPVISGSLTFAEGATFTMPDNGVYSGSFSGSFQGDGSSLTFGGTNLVSGSSQISYSGISDKPTLVSSSVQVEFNDINNNPFTQGASTVTVDKHIVPTNLSIDLGTVTTPFRDLYLSSASLYIDGTKVMSSDSTELIITTDTNQSLKLVETGADTVQIQTQNGDITLTSTGTGNIELDAPIQIVAGNQIISSDGNAIQFGEDIDIDGDLNVQGNITLTGTVDGVDVAALSDDVTAILSGSSADKDSFAEIVSLINSIDTSNDEAFASFYTSSNQRMSSLEDFTSSIDSTIKTKLNVEEIVSGSSQVVLENADKTGFTGASSINTLGTITTGTWQGSIIASQYLDADPLPDGTVSGSSQVVLEDADKTGFTGASSITTLGTVTSGNVTSILPAGTISGSEQVNINSTTGNLTSLGTVTVGNVNAILPTGVISGSTQVSFDEISDKPTLVSGSSQVVLEDADKTGFTGASTITTLGTIGTGVWQGSVIASQYLDADPLPDGTVSGSAQVVLEDADKTGFTGASSITTLGTVTSGNVTSILPAGVISGSGQLTDYVTTNSDQALASSTALTLSTNTLTLTKGDGTTDTVDLSAYLDEDARSIASGTLDGSTGIVTFTRDDSTTFTLDLSDLLDDTNLVTSVNGKAGVVTLVPGDLDLGTSDTVRFGKVGVGTAADSTYELKVSGDIGATGDIVAYISSDERLKKNIEIISKPIDKVKQLKGVTWVWKDEASDAAKQSPNVGVIAQDVEKVLPQLVHDRENGYKGVDYSKMVGLLIEAIKDQQKQIDDLKSRLK